MTNVERIEKLREFGKQGMIFAIAAFKHIEQCKKRCKTNRCGILELLKPYERFHEIANKTFTADNVIAKSRKMPKV